MRQLERIFWACLAVLLGSGSLISRSSQIVGNVQTIRASRIEVTDPSGRPRIVIATDSDGVAQISFVSPDGKNNSRIRQYGDGAMSLEFAGKTDRPSVYLTSDFSHSGPRLLLTGNTWPEQRILLGFKTDDVPSGLSYTWGLFFPTIDGFHDFASIGATRDVRTGQTSGYVLPRK